MKRRNKELIETRLAHVLPRDVTGSSKGRAHVARRSTRKCAEPGCENGTSCKPYCMEHLDRLEYVARVIGEAE